MSNPTTATIPTHNQVTRDNLAEVQPKVTSLLKQAAFIALDVEFTGFGDNVNATKAHNLQERYVNLSDIAKSHALIAFGLSIFIRKQQTKECQKQHLPPTSQDVARVAKEETALHSTGNNNDHEQDEGLITRGDRSLERAFIVHNFNFSMLKSHDFNVTPNSMRFLAETGVDLNQWVKDGIAYKDGNDTASSGKDDPNAIMRAIFRCIMTRHVPVIIHNGFLDLIFLYQSFYLDLPPKLSMFTADLSDMFPAGIYDTKYISDYMTHERVSFLSYLFRKYERADTQTRLRLSSTATESAQSHTEGYGQKEVKEVKSHSDVKSTTPKKRLVYSTFDIQERLLLHTASAKNTFAKRKEGITEICEHFAHHGHCRKGIRCEQSHDLDVILDHEDNMHKKSKKQRTEPVTEETSPRAEDENKREPYSASTALTTEASIPTTTTPTTLPPTTSLHETPLVVVPTVENSALTPEKFHSAYFDAYMTGTVFSHQLNIHTRAAVEAQARNRIYLIGKSIPLIAEKSSYAQYSPGHLQKSRGGRTL